MTQIANFVFNNILLVVIGFLGYYVYREYKDLKEKTISINEIFVKTLNKYLESKMTEAKDAATKVMNQYTENELIAAEVNRLLYQIENFEKGTINDKVSASNSINKFKVSKKIDKEKYPGLNVLENLGTFTEQDMESVDNGVAIARKEYNVQAFRYNEKANGFPMQYLTKLFKLNAHFIIFDAPKYAKYEENYEVFEEQEPEINSLTVLNRAPEVEEVVKNIMQEQEAEVLDTPEVTIEYSDVILKPSKKIIQEIQVSELEGIIDLPAEKTKQDEDKEKSKDKDKNKNKDENKNKKN